MLFQTQVDTDGSVDMYGKVRPPATNQNQTVNQSPSTPAVCAGRTHQDAAVQQRDGEVLAQAMFEYMTLPSAKGHLVI